MQNAQNAFLNTPFDGEGRAFSQGWGALLAITSSPLVPHRPADRRGVGIHIVSGVGRTDTFLSSIYLSIYLFIFMSILNSLTLFLSLYSLFLSLAFYLPLSLFLSLSNLFPLSIFHILSLSLCPPFPLYCQLYPPIASITLCSYFLISLQCM